MYIETPVPFTYTYTSEQIGKAARSYLPKSTFSTTITDYDTCGATNDLGQQVIEELCLFRGVTMIEAKLHIGLKTCHV
jgi:hypothetical protein